MSTTERKTFTADQRKALAAKGHAMPDGSFPIENTSDLKNAISLHGNASDPAAAKAHIKKRAKALGATHMLPKDWVASSEQQQNNSAEPPRDELIRAVMDGGVELRESNGDGRLGTLAGHFATFNRWTTIDSAYEGKFREQIAPGAFSKTFDENRAGMRVLFQHGKDPQVGDKVLGPIDILREDDVGAYYEVPLLDTSYNRDLMPGLEAGLYGASFRFRVLRQKLEKRPADGGMPERTVSEAAVKEFGPVTFPAYEGATAGMRSMTDEFMFANLLNDPERLRRLVEYMPRETGETEETEYHVEADAPLEPRRAPSAPDSGRRGHTREPLYGATQRRKSPSWLLPR